jgi:predicted RND superfamily exporter protein
MSFLRHIGKIGDRKVAIIFREIPGEPHMGLVVYTELLNAHLHDAVMRTIESDIGQASENLADALNRSYTQDGKIILQVLHTEGILKKVQTSQVLVTPNTNTVIKLDELNKMLNEMKQGEEAVKKLTEMDNRSGMKTPAEVARKMRDPVVSPDVLDDMFLAKQRIEQAEKMEREASGLMNEAKRLREEAIEMAPSLKPKATKTTKASKAKIVEAVVEPTKPVRATRKVKTTA